MRRRCNNKYFLQLNTKRQYPSRQDALLFYIEDLEFLWGLELGIWSF
jgi:hypothetical protein